MLSTGDSCVPASTQRHHRSSNSSTHALPPLQHTLATHIAVTVGAIAFAALLAHLSHIVLPIALIVGLSLLQRPSVRVWPVQTWHELLQRFERSTPPPTRNDNSETTVHTPLSSSIDCKPLQQQQHASSSALPAPTPVKHRRTKRTAASSLQSLAPSLRVTDLGVANDGAPLRLDVPRALLGDYVVTPNSETPYAFENDFVRGELLFLLNNTRPHATDTASQTNARVARLFDGKRRLFWVQMQLQFKQTPSGIVYIGGEVPQPMALGFFTGGLVKIILRVLQSLVSGLHFGFGKEVEGTDTELPHICFPLYTAVDQFVCTPSGSNPPALGSLDFGESKAASVARRRSGDALFMYNTHDTYSFHFHSYFIDFQRWKLENIPGMRDVDLSAFWRDMPLQLVAYSLKPPLASAAAVDNTQQQQQQQQQTPLRDSDAKKKAVHSHQTKEYKFCFELSHCVQPPICSESNDLLLEETSSNASSTNKSELDEPESDTIAIQQQLQQQLRDVQTQLARFDMRVPAWLEYFSSSSVHSERRVAYVLCVRTRVKESNHTARRSYTVLLHTALSAFVPLSFLEHDALLQHSNNNGFLSHHHHRSAKTLDASIAVRARSYKYNRIDDERSFLETHLQQLAHQQIDVSATTTTKQLEQLVAAQSALLALLQPNEPTTLQTEWPFLSATSCRSNSFHSMAPVPAADVPAATSIALQDAPHAAVQVVRIASMTRWRHEWLTLDSANRVVRFFRMLESSSSFAIPLDHVLRIDVVVANANESNQSTDRVAVDSSEKLYWIHIELLDKCHHIAFGTRSEQLQWLAALQAASGGEHVLAARLAEPIVESCARLSLEQFARTSARSRFVLNDRCDWMQHTHHSAVSSSLSSPSPSSSSLGQHDDSDSNDPQAVVAQCLRQALALQTMRLQAGSTHALVAFQHAVSDLKWLDLRSVLQSASGTDTSEDAAKKVLFLNLFHTLQLHASVLGFLPHSKLQWSKFFNNVSYNIGGLVFSLAEIEHCVLRASMAPLRLPIAFLVLPRKFDASNDARAACALVQADFRLNFALNCMTKSCARTVAVFTLDGVDAQLDCAVRSTLELLLSYDRETRVVYLPKACDWYRGDFVAAAASAAATTDSDDDANGKKNSSSKRAVLELLVPFVSGSKRELLEYVLAHDDTLVAKYKFTKYDYRFQDALVEETSSTGRVDA